MTSLDRIQVATEQALRRIDQIITDQNPNSDKRRENREIWCEDLKEIIIFLSGYANSSDEYTNILSQIHHDYINEDKLLNTPIIEETKEIEEPQHKTKKLFTINLKQDDGTKI